MPEIKILHIISYSSQDPKFSVENLIKGAGPWLCSPEDRSGSLRAEFQLQKATSIEYIDIGNSNSAMLSIEVGSSTWSSSQDFRPLLPTVMLISPADWRAGKNLKAVQMFKKENLDDSNASKKWDRIRVICSNPFRKDTQYGLEFLKLYFKEEVNYNDTALPIFSSVEETEKKSKFMSHLNFKAKSTSSVMSSCLRSLETNRMNAGDTDSYDSSSATEVKSPLSRAAKLVMAKKYVPNQSDALKEKKELEMEGLNFLISCNLSANDINNLKVSHIREEFELKRNKALTTREKLIFKNIALDYAAQRLKRMDEEAQATPETINLECSNDTRPAHQSSSKKFHFKSDITKDSIKSSHLESPSSYEFDKFNNEIKHSFFSRPVSAKRIRLREEENITPQTPSGIDRNNLALDDCVVTTDSSFQSRKKLKYCVDKTGSPHTSNLNVWLSPNLEKNRTSKDLFQIKSRKNSSKDKNLYESKEICSTDSSSDSDCTPLKEVNLQNKSSNSSFTLGSKPKNKFGIQQDYIKNSENNKSVTLLECPLCTELFSSEIIEEHASCCSLERLKHLHEQIEEVAMEECPICSEMYDTSDLKEHAEQCAEKYFS